VKVLRSALVQHLNKIACGGRITEAVFGDAFATRALSPDQMLLVNAPTLPDVEPLEEEIGVSDLSMVIRAFGFIPGEGNEGADVHVYVEDGRLIIDEEEHSKARQYLMTASPKTIGTRIEEATAKKLLDKAPSGKGLKLTRQLVQGIQKTFSGYKATEIELFIGKKGGHVRVGNENGHYAEFESKDLKGKEEYSVLFGGHLVDVLAQVTDFTSAELRLGGPGQMAVVQDGDYQYLLGPKKRAADEKQTKTKPAASSEEKPTKRRTTKKKASSDDEE